MISRETSSIRGATTAEAAAATGGGGGGEDGEYYSIKTNGQKQQQ